MDLYAEQILDHAKHPHHTGSLAEPTIVHDEANLSCGDRVHLELLVEDDTVKDIAWTGAGCAVSQAGMSLLSEALEGKNIDDLLGLSKEDVLELLGVPVSARRLKCALLGLHTLKNALLTHRGQPSQSWAETVADTEGA